MDVNTFEQQHRQTLIKLLFELACKCPAKQQPNCPLTKSRMLSPEQLNSSIAAKSTRELDYLYQSHLECLKKQSLSCDKTPIAELYI